MKRLSSKQGFTLVELLVVIGIIALLISILMPALSGARRAANAIKCSANLRSIAQAAQVYISQNNGWLPASAWTSGRHLYPTNQPVADGKNPNQGNCPVVSHINDWQSPLGRIMGMKFNMAGDQVSRAERFLYLMDRPQFRCPSNDTIALVPPSEKSLMQSKGVDFYQSPSYAIAVDFMYKRTGGPVEIGEEGETYALSTHNPPEGYTPKINKIGNPSEKVFMGCGAKYSNLTTPPSLQFTYKFDYGGSYGDRGPWITANAAWNRGLAPGNSGTGTTDARIYGFRHGKNQSVRGPADSYRFIVAFWDGHVGTFGDLEGSNPAWWNPKGTQVAYSRMENDVKKRFYNTTATSGFVTVP